VDAGFSLTHAPYDDEANARGKNCWDFDFQVHSYIQHSPLVFFEGSGVQSHDERANFLCVSLVLSHVNIQG